MRRLLLLLWTLACCGIASGEKTCRTYVRDWIETQRREDASRKQNLEKMLFFLHVPRTAGRSFRKCFLGKAFPPSERCENSYQGVSLNQTNPKCRLLSSHDDLSLLQRLPDETALMTQLRDPVQRVLSAYGFALEVSSRVLLRSKMQKASSKKKSSPMESIGRVQTDRVWPWSTLLPWMKETLWTRINESTIRTKEGRTMAEETSERGTVSLEEFIDHDLVHASIHNNMMFQVLGITSYSTLPNAGMLQECVAKDAAAGQLLYDLAEERLQNQFILSITENLHESAELVAFKLGRSLKGRAWKAGLGGPKSSPSDAEYEETNKESEMIQQAVVLGREVNKLVDQLLLAQANKKGSTALDRLLKLGVRMDKNTPSVAEISQLLRQNMKKLASTISILKKKNVPVDELGLRDPLMLDRRSLGHSFLDCMEYQRSKAVDLSAKLFEKLQKKYGPAVANKLRFSSTARANVHPSTLESIRSLNSWDMKLYEFSKKVFSEQVQEAKKNPLFESMPQPGSARSSVPANLKLSQRRRSHLQSRAAMRRADRVHDHGSGQIDPAE